MDNTKQDFIQQYTEILDIVKELSSYDPTVSSESDPMVVQLKIIAMMGDKLSYNRDKSVRELFPSTVQQRGNALELYDIVGYHIKGNLSAIGEVILRKDEKLLSNPKIERFTKIQDINGVYRYVTTNEVILTTESRVVVIEGEHRQLEIAGATTITSQDLDANNRLYLPDKNVAENGIFVSSTNGSYTRVNNIYKDIGDTFMVGEDDGMYIQFSQLTEEITVDYIISSGTSGNCKIGVLTRIADEIVEGEFDIAGMIRVIQPAAIANGYDAEDLLTAYKNFKRHQGRFNTIITEQDFESFMYEALYENGIPVYSNVAVASRLNDLNKTVKIKTLNEFRTVNRYNEMDDTLYVYGLKSSGDYNGQFEPAGDTELNVIEDMLYEDQQINKTITTPVGNSGYLAEYELKGTVMLKDRVTRSEAENIYNNIQRNLKSKLSARSMEFGKNLEYTELITRIKESDNRILNVALDVPEYSFKQMKGENKEKELTAKMILNGTMQGFEFDDRFELGFEKDIQNTITEIKKIRTEVETSLPNVQRTIKANEIVQVRSDVYETTIEYGLNTKYKLTVITTPTVVDIEIAHLTTLNAGTVLKTGSKIVFAEDVTIASPIDAGTGSIVNGEETTDEIAGGTLIESGSIVILAADYTLGENSEIGTGSIIKAGSTIEENTDSKTKGEWRLGVNEKLEITYSEDGVSRTTSYQGKVIETNFDMQTGEEKSLSGGQSIKIKELRQRKINKGTEIYLLGGDELNIEAGKEIILDDNEYLVYTLNGEIIMLNPGIKVRNESDVDLTLSFDRREDVEELDEWEELPVSLEIIDQEIWSFGAGVQFECDEALDSEYKEIGSIAFTGDTGLALVKSYKKYHARHLLNILAAPSQEILAGQKVFITDTNDNEIEITGETIEFSEGLAMPGSKEKTTDLSIITYTLGERVGIINADKTITHTFTEDVLIPVQKQGTVTITSVPSGVMVVSGKILSTAEDGTYTLKIPKNTTEITVNGSDDWFVNFGKMSIITKEIEDESEDSLLETMQAQDTDGIFDYTYRVESPLSIDEYWNPNHLANKFTIAKLDLDRTFGKSLNKGSLKINQGQINV